MQALFNKLLADIHQQNGFRDYGPEEWARLPQPEGHLRRPLYEGDFATTTDASLLLEQGVDVPQEIINLTRISTTRALEKVMPDWAVQEWLHVFLQSNLSGKADVIFTQYREALNHMPVPGRFPPRFFDYRVKADGNSNGVFSSAEIKSATKKLSGDHTHIIAGVLLWQFALQNYAAALGDYAKTKNETRVVEFCNFLSKSAFLLASFSALLPIAITLQAHAGNALEEFSARGGFIKHAGTNRMAYIFNYLHEIFKLRLKPFALPSSKSRAIVCSAKEAIVRWANLPLPEQTGGSLGTYIATTEKLMQHNESWRQMDENIRHIIQSNSRSRLWHLGAETCPYHHEPSPHA